MGYAPFKQTKRQLFTMKGIYQDGPEWTSVTGAELEGFLSQINPIDGIHRVNPDTTKVAWRSIPFYEGIALIRVTDPSFVPSKLKVFYLAKEDKLYRLNGQSLPIHQMNELAPCSLNEDNILDYVRFFCYFVRGEDGPFLVCEDIQDPCIPKGDAKTHAAIAGVVREANYQGKNEAGHYMVDAIIFYGNALFLSNFEIQPSGMIEMLNDEPMTSDLDVRPDLPVA